MRCWRRCQPFARAERSLDEGIFLLHQQIGMRTRVLFLSDTLVVGVDAPQAEKLLPPDKGRLIHAACMVAQKVAMDLLDMQPPLASRGCATFGRFDMAGNFLIGPAVDEAAELHELADGAFLWIPPQYALFLEAERQVARDMVRAKAEGVDILQLINAAWETYGAAQMLAEYKNQLTGLTDVQREAMRQVCRDIFAHPQNDWNMPLYDMPLKDRRTLQCAVVGPGDQPDLNALVLKYNAAMKSNALDVIIKRQNTMRFLRHVQIRNQRLNPYWAEKRNEINRIVQG